MNIPPMTSPLPLIVQVHLFVLTRLVVVTNGTKNMLANLCSKLVIKMSDHLVRCHRDEVEFMFFL